jgi:endonuclease YncB( thermonuclease family)
MASPYHRLIRGAFVIVGKEPDGDSVRFIADNPALYQQLRNAHRIRLSGDGSVQLRFEGVDAPEVHYGEAAQPRGPQAREALLEWIGFTGIEFAPVPNENRVTAATPASVRGAILSKAAEANGRPVSFVALEGAVSGRADGAWVRLTPQLLERTLNFRLLQEGMAYLTLYSSTPQADRLRAAARVAKDADLGLWADDVTKQFKLTDQASIGPGGALILPKLFRRCTDHLKDADRGFAGNLDDWLLAHTGGNRPENDGVVVCGIELRQSDLVVQRNRTIVFQPDTLDTVFIEK